MAWREEWRHAGLGVQGAERQKWEYTRSPRRASRRKGENWGPTWGRAGRRCCRRRARRGSSGTGRRGTEPRWPRSRAWSVGPEAEETSDRMSWGKRGLWLGVPSVEAATLLFVKERDLLETFCFWEMWLKLVCVHFSLGPISTIHSPFSNPKKLWNKIWLKSKKLILK